MLTEKMQTVKDLADSKGYPTTVRNLTDRVFLNISLADGWGFAIEANFEDGKVRHIVDKTLYGFGSRISMKSLVDFLAA